jgi:hypothetical protein
MNANEYSLMAELAEASYADFSRTDKQSLLGS